MMAHDINYYTNLPYHIEIIKDNNPENPGWVASIAELPGCLTQADTFEELEENISSALRAWVETALEENIEIPEPRIEEEFSGKFVVRVPKSLHRELVAIAARENVSLNTYISTALGSSVGKFNISPKPITGEVETTPIIAWSKLSDKARRILISYGLKNEAQEVDEKMFAGWIEDNLFQIQSSIDQSDYHSALRYIQSVKQALEMLCGQSPLISTYCQIVELLAEQINLNTKLRDGLVEQNFVKSRISAQTKETTQYPEINNRQAQRDSAFQEIYKEMPEQGNVQLSQWIRKIMEAK